MTSTDIRNWTLWPKIKRDKQIQAAPTEEYDAFPRFQISKFKLSLVILAAIFSPALSLPKADKSALFKKYPQLSDPNED
jgi:hypothetical protein